MDYLIYLLVNMGLKYFQKLFSLNLIKPSVIYITLLNAPISGPVGRFSAKVSQEDHEEFSIIKSEFKKPKILNS